MSVSAACPSFIQPDVPLAPMTTFRIGGAARWFARPGNPEEMSLATAFAAGQGLPVFVLGGGSNILVADAGVKGVVIRPEGEFAAFASAPDNDLVWRVGAAVPLATLLSRLADAGVTGLEFLAGIPGRVGGAVAMNAGAWGESIGLYVQEALVHDADSGGRIVPRSDLSFSYRHSGLGGMTGLAFTFLFPGKTTPAAIRRKMQDCRKRKKAAQPLTLPSAGCVFRNPPGASAGKLLDEAGCKGLREGAAEVSGVHANFIVNRGGATAADVLRLMERMREAVREKAAVRLEAELIVWGNNE